jgi:hypothetical protein
MMSLEFHTLNHTVWLLFLLITSLLLASHVPPAKASTIIDGGAIIGNQAWTRVEAHILSQPT